MHSWATSEGCREAAGYALGERPSVYYRFLQGIYNITCDPTGLVWNLVKVDFYLDYCELICIVFDKPCRT